MSRIDIQTLVMAFEKRIEALEKNPPDKVPTHVILNMLEKSIDEIIKDHFLHLIRNDIKKNLTVQFKEMKNEFIEQVINDMLTSSDFRQNLVKKMKQSILDKIL